MGKRLFVLTATVMVIFGLVFLTSCAKESVKSESSDLQDTEQVEYDASAAEEEAEATAEEEAAKEKAAEEEEAAVKEEMEKAREAFVDEKIHFDFDKSSLTAEAREILRSKAAWLRNNPDTEVVIEGHCDERGTAEYNLALGDRRANSAKEYLVDMGIEDSRLETVSYGEEEPLDSSSTEEAWEKNRRAEFDIK
ncbi:MAG: peptidoglycan-associated lipoprotein Pal [Desulfosudaceae bacterium]